MRIWSLYVGKEKWRKKHEPKGEQNRGSYGGMEIAVHSMEN
jgi:hypothetical protein